MSIFRLSAIAAWLLAAAATHAQPKLVLTQVGSDLAGDGNTVIGSILDANVHTQITTYTRGTGFAFAGGSVLSQYGKVLISDLTAGSFAASAGISNGMFGTPYWPPSNPGLFGNVAFFRPCCVGSTCTIVDSSLCTGLALDTPSGACEPNPCPPDPNPPAIGACCNRTTLVCTVTSLAGCASPDYWIGNITTCSNYPCSYGHILPFRYASSTDVWSNTGAIPDNTGGPGLGSSTCGQDIANPYDMSADGRFIVSNSWYGGFGTLACGTRGYIYDNADGSAQMLPLIDTPAGCQNLCQAHGVSSNGNVIVGRDTHASTNPAGELLSCNESCLTVWERDIATGEYLLPRTARACCDGSSCTVVDPGSCVGLALVNTSCTPNPCPPSPNPPASGACCDSQSMNCSITTQAACLVPNFWIGAATCTRSPCLPSTETVLDEYGSGGLYESVVTRSGTVVAGWVSAGTAEFVLNDPAKSGSLCKYIKNIGTGGWDRVVLGKCAARCAEVGAMQVSGISDDGNVIVGTALYGGSSPFFACEVRGFIWSPSINSGVPIDLEVYMTSLNGGLPYPPTGGLGSPVAISSDGNAVLVSWTPPAPACPPDTGLQDLARSGILYLNGTGISCEPPSIADGPYDVAQDEFTRYGIPCNVFIAGSYPMTMRWQKEVPTGSNNWVDLDDSCGELPPDSSWVYEGTHGFQLRINMITSAAARDGNFRVVATNACGTAISGVASIRAVTGACCYDSNGSVVCTLEMGSRCTGTLDFLGYLNGVYLGDNTACSPAACAPVTGACCYGEGGPNAACVLDVVTHCTNPSSAGGLSGAFAGGMTVCGPAVCGAISGACCYSADNVSTICVVDLGLRCPRLTVEGGLGGVYAGDGTVCAAGDTCPPGTVGVGACCFNTGFVGDIICSILPMTRCTDPDYFGGWQGKFLGDGSTCSPNSCTPSESGTGSGLGACCFTDPDNTASGVLCTIRSSPNCRNYPNGASWDNNPPYTTGVAGIFHEGQCCQPSSTAPIDGCDTSTNCAPFFGACIASSIDGVTDATCTIQNQARCERRFYEGGLFGRFLGVGTVCTPAALAANAGACCHAPPFGGCPICTIEPADADGGSLRCTEEFNGGLAGAFSGVGTTCSPTSCPPSAGACCLDGACSITCEAICSLDGGTYIGVGTTCDADPCNPNPTGACCCGSSCSLTTSTACSGPGRSFAGAATSCAPYSANAPCCRGNYNKSAPGPGAPGGISVQDIFDFLTGYFSSDPCANTNDSAAGPDAPNGISVQDIFDFLSAYFGGC